MISVLSFIILRLNDCLLKLFYFELLLFQRVTLPANSTSYLCINETA